MRRRTLSIACAAVAALGLIIWLTSSRVSKAPAADTSDQRAARVPPPPTAAGDSPATASAATPAPRKAALTKIDPAQRAQLRAAIARARAARETPAASAATPAKTAVTFELDPGETRERIRAHIREVQPLLAECYELELARKPDLAGNLQVRFTIDGEPAVGGIVSESEITGGSLAEQQEMVICVRETLFTAKFDAPEAGGTIVVEYPFVFSSK